MFKTLEDIRARKDRGGRRLAARLKVWGGEAKTLRDVWVGAKAVYREPNMRGSSKYMPHNGEQEKARRVRQSA